MRVATKDGRQYSGAVVEASDAHITVARYGKNIKISKGNVARVYYLRQKPLSDNTEYWVQECAFLPLCMLNPNLWPYVLNIGVKFPVLLYDSSMPEDDAPVECKTRVPWR